MPCKQPIVGKYSFAHESGIHTYGVLTNPSTYEPYPPELVGNSRNLTIGKQSGKAVIKHKIIEVTGSVPDSETVAVVEDKVKACLCDWQKKIASEDEFKAILYNTLVCCQQSLPTLPQSST
jgi:isopropylmalate/homocitrate/citramalate synthase